MSSLPDDPPDGYEATVETGHLDAEHRFSIHLRDRAAPWAQAACRIFVREGCEPELHTAFAIGLLPVALREDVPAQERAVAALESVLARAFGPRGDTLAAATREAWNHTIARLEARWREIEAMDEPVGPDRLSILPYRSVRYPVRHILAVVAQTTRSGQDGQFGVFDRIGGEQSIDWRITTAPATRETVAALGELSAHQKLDLLAGRPVAPPPRLRTLFDRERLIDDPIRPLRCHPSRAWGKGMENRRNGVSIRFPDGVEGHLLHGYETTNTRIIHCSASKDGWSVGIHAGRLQPLLVKPARRKTMTPARLDTAMRRIVTMILIDDEPVALDAIMTTDDPFDPAHPLLAGQDVPPRHRPFIGMILGAPYRKAREEAAASAAEMAAWNAKVEAAKAAAKTRKRDEVTS